jgi:hypothetical protein
MKDIQAAQQNLKKAVDAKTAAAAMADAVKMHDAFLQVEAFWKQRNTEDAVKSAGDSVQAASKVVAAAKTDNADDLAAGFTAVGAQCRNCHTAHRERLPDGTYKIK